MIIMFVQILQFPLIMSTGEVITVTQYWLLGIFETMQDYSLNDALKFKT